MDRKIFYTIIIFFVLICLSGCALSDKQITEGEVYDKEYRAATVMVIPMTVVHSNGEYVYTSIVPITWYYPDRYVIFIRAYDSENNEWKTEDFYVEKETYDLIETGDYFVFDEETMLKEEPKEKAD